MPVADFDLAAFASSLPPFLRAPFDYWNAKRGLRPMPFRADIDPVEMRAWLPQTMLVEPTGDGDFLVRLISTEVRTSIGVDMTGRKLSELPVPAAHLDELLDEYRLTVALRRPTYHVHEHPDLLPRRSIRFERLLAPLSRDGRRVDMLLGVRWDRLGAAPAQPSGASKIPFRRASPPQSRRRNS